MTAITFSDAYPDPKREVCSSIFQNTEAMNKNWSSMIVAAGMDDSSFFTVVANHPVFPKVLDASVHAVDLSHSSASKNFRVGQDEQNALVVVLLRIMTTIHPPSTIGKNALSSTSVGLRLSQLIPPSTVLPISLILQRVNGRIATAALACFVLQAPSFLARLPSAVATWCDNIDAIACKCVAESRRGRFQRTAGDILALIESTYRTTKHMWALLQSLPFLADFVPLDKLLHGLRIVVDVISPLLQYFVLACDSLTTRRAHLSRANAMVNNAAVGTAVVAVLFSTFLSTETGRHEALLPEKHKTLSEAIVGEIEQNTHGGVPLALLKRCRGSVPGILAELCPPPAQRLLGPTLCAFLNPITSVDIKAAVTNSKGTDNTTERFFEVLLLELVHQGISIDMLVRRRFVGQDEARRLGASEATVQSAAGASGVADSDDDDAPRKNPAKQADKEAKLAPPVTKKGTIPTAAMPALDEQVALVLSVIPDLNPEAVANALEDYYHRDVEHFIVDATSDNLPPHLAASLHAPVAASPHKTKGDKADPSTSSHMARRASQALCGEGPPQSQSVWVDGLELVDEHMDRLISSDFHDLAAAEEADVGTGGGGYQIGRSDFDDDGLQHREESTMMTLYTDAASASSDFFVDDEMKEKIKQLHEMMYDDERDDAQDGGDVVGFVDADTYDDDETDTKANRNTSGADGATSTNPRRGAASSASPEASPAGSPAAPASAKAAGSNFPKYASKSKSTRHGAKDRAGGEGGRAGDRGKDGRGNKGERRGGGDRPPTKADLNRAVKRGAFD